MRHISDDERRARIARQHAIAPGERVPDAEAATRAMTVLHATEPATVYLSLFARVDGLGVADVDRVPAAGRRALAAQASRLTEWLGGVRVSTAYPSPAMKVGLPLPGA